jgi:flagellar basal body-associated protein FliL
MEIIVAIIGAIAAIATTWITVRYKAKKGQENNKSNQENVHGNNVIGDVVAGDKSESHVHIQGREVEKKSRFVYIIQILFTFIFTSAVAGALFGWIGYLIAQETGAVIGGVLAFFAGIVNAGSIKRTKGLL